MGPFLYQKTASMTFFDDWCAKYFFLSENSFCSHAMNCLFPSGSWLKTCFDNF